jgi:hypothetical protein
MSIFEDKKHNGLPYIGQKPVVPIMTPQDTSDATYGIINHAIMTPMSVRNIRNKDEEKQ